MSRLRKAIRRYNDPDNNTDSDDPSLSLLDSSAQDDVILELKAALANSRAPSSTFINIIIVAVVLMNLSLLTLPYYKVGINSVWSLFTVVCSLLNFIVLKYDRYQVYLGSLSKSTLLWISCGISATIIGTKLSTFQIRDIVYVVPLLNCFGLYLMKINFDDMSEEIKKLEKLKYNYKEA